MLILFNKAITVACFAMRCWQFFLLPHFSQSIDADMNVSAAHSLKLQRKIGWDLLWGGNPCHSVDGNIFVSALLLSPVNVPTLSSCCEGHLTFSVGVRCPRGDIQPCSGVTPAAVPGAEGAAGILPWSASSTFLASFHWVLLHLSRPVMFVLEQQTVFWMRDLELKPWIWDPVCNPLDFSVI